MKWLIKTIDWSANFFGSLTFIATYNIGTFTWMLLGRFAPWFPDKYPFNFYTMVVSWLAINTASFILYVDRRKEMRAKKDEEHQRRTLDTLLTLSEAQSSMIPLIKRIAENQVVIFEIIAEQEEMKLSHANDEVDIDETNEVKV